MLQFPHRIETTATDYESSTDKSLQDDVCNHLRDQVMFTGSLITTFQELPDSLTWFDDNQEQLLGLALQSIFQAYSLRLASYIACDHEARCRSDWHEYNQCLGYVRDIIISLTAALPELINKVDTKLTELVTKRRAGVRTETGGPEAVFGAMENIWLVDEASKRRFHTTGERAKEVMDRERDQYKSSYLTQLDGHAPHSPIQLQPFLLNLRDQHGLLLSRQGPSNPMYAPTVPEPIDTGKSSDWPLLIGDGYAALDTAWEIWVTMKVEGEPIEKLPAEDADEIRLATISGHGIIQWPKPSAHPIHSLALLLFLPRGPHFDSAYTLHLAF
ncbi:uncharacterized protein PAC_16353 [Phialocephala subalpina]|uniref:Uncharacterized protein n=1 Tax=Phialocephala subalpina TaxID=576137 RepID=A0A1L7XN42_9HELO|nr:uncharacterized protein PAC_16353 [Phialocephala subalpina]